MKIVAWSVVLGLMLTGCASSQDGKHLFIGAHNQGDYDRVRAQLQQNAQSSVAKELVVQSLNTQQPGLIIIGTVGSLRTMKDDDKPALYASYAKRASMWRTGRPPEWSEADFKSQAGGFTTVETAGIPGVIAMKYPALVKVQDLSRIEFVSSFVASWVGNTGDLVATRSNADGMTIVETVLCRHAASDFRQCVSRYEKGRFDLTTGAELDVSLKLKEGGARIDPTSFQVIERAHG